jgi:hypothetical protein
MQTEELDAKGAPQAPLHKVSFPIPELTSDASHSGFLA